MRLNLTSRMRAMVLTSRVLARPGTPTRRQCPPVKIAARICSITVSCPMMTLCSSSVMMSRCLRNLSRNSSKSRCSGGKVSRFAKEGTGFQNSKEAARVAKVHLQHPLDCLADSDDHEPIMSRKLRQHKSAPPGDQPPGNPPARFAAAAQASAWRAWDWILLCGLLVFTFLSLCYPLMDTDFWWHLKTG